jgi:aspartate carbamoyltransferase catalytic subunit
MSARQHLLGINNLSLEELHRHITNGEQMLEVLGRSIKKVPTLRGRSVINLFLEPSTRTRTSFELAAKRLSADSINISESSSSVSKGETLLDTAKTLEAMAPDIIVLRHSSSGAPHFLANHLSHTSIINGGDGANEHPTQALLDLLTIKQALGTLENLKVAIIGDILHSRVARSNLYALGLLGSEVRLIGPPGLVPSEFLQAAANFKCNISGIYHSLTSKSGSPLEDVDVIIVLRMQRERQNGHLITSLSEYSKYFCLTEEIFRRYAKPETVLLHPGPVNRGIEVGSALIDSANSLNNVQVKCGVALRMALLLAFGIAQ